MLFGMLGWYFFALWSTMAILWPDRLVVTGTPRWCHRNAGTCLEQYGAVVTGCNNGDGMTTLLVIRHDHLFGIVLHDGVTWSVWQKKKFRRHFLPHRWLDSDSLDCFARNSICFDHFDLHPLIILSTEPPDDQMMQVNMTQDNHQQSTHIDDKEMDEGQSLT